MLPTKYLCAKQIFSIYMEVNNGIEFDNMERIEKQSYPKVMNVKCLIKHPSLFY